MSAKVDRERAEARREEAIDRARERTRILDRVIDMYEDWLTDTEIASSLGCSSRTIKRHRKQLGLGEYAPARAGRAS